MDKNIQEYPEKKIKIAVFSLFIRPK